VDFRPILRVSDRSSRQFNALANGAIVAAVMIAFLHIGREILLPLVIATLLASFWPPSSAGCAFLVCGRCHR
jgi:predicted PurR-regulated permease PerM